MGSRKRRRGTDDGDDCFISDDADESRCFLNPDAVSEHLYCSICQEVFTNPQRGPCGHSFCKQCILPWLRKSNTCPEDRKQLRIQDLHHDFILENIIGDQLVACSFRVSGCDFIGQLQCLKSHKNSCSFNPVNLPDFLKEEVSFTDEPCPNSSVAGDKDLPAPAQPSLKMRLFCAGGNQRSLLCKMFKESKENGTP